MGDWEGFGEQRPARHNDYAQQEPLSPAQRIKRSMEPLLENQTNTEPPEASDRKTAAQSAPRLSLASLTRPPIGSSGDTAQTSRQTARNPDTARKGVDWRKWYAKVRPCCSPCHHHGFRYLEQHRKVEQGKKLWIENLEELTGFIATLQRAGHTALTLDELMVTVHRLPHPSLNHPAGAHG